MVQRTHSEALPISTDALISMFKRAISLRNVLDIHITNESFSVTRDMESETDPVFPKSSDTVDADLEYVLSRVAENLGEMFEPSLHPYEVMVRATRGITERRLRVCGIMAPRGTLFSDYFGLDEGSMPDQFLGIKVIYHDLIDRYPDKIVVFGGPTIYFNDATHGVIIDTGV